MKTLGDVYKQNRDKMRGGPMAGGPGTTPLGDRPGTTTVNQIESWSGTPAGAARIIAAVAFLMFTFVHVAAEARFSAGA